MPLLGGYPISPTINDIVNVNYMWVKIKDRETSSPANIRMYLYFKLASHPCLSLKYFLFQLHWHWPWDLWCAKQFYRSYSFVLPACVVSFWKACLFLFTSPKIPMSIKSFTGTTGYIHHGLGASVFVSVGWLLRL